MRHNRRETAVTPLFTSANINQTLLCLIRRQLQSRSDRKWLTKPDLRDFIVIFYLPNPAEVQRQIRDTCTGLLDLQAPARIIRGSTSDSTCGLIRPKSRSHLSRFFSRRLLPDSLIWMTSALSYTYTHIFSWTHQRFPPTQHWPAYGVHDVGDPALRAVGVRTHARLDWKILMDGGVELGQVLFTGNRKGQVLEGFHCVRDLFVPNDKIRKRKTQHQL